MNTIKNDTKFAFWRTTLLFYVAAGMIIAIFCSRAALSILTVMFIAAAFMHREIREQARQFLHSPLLWSMSLLFLLPFISGLWSEDKSNWVSFTFLKLPLLLMPLAFARDRVFTNRQCEWLAYIFIGLVTGSSIWSMSHYLSNMSAIHEEYLKAKTLLSPFNIGRVRFGWMISISILLCTWLGFQKRKTNTKLACILITIAAWLILFLHIIALRTGLISFYAMVFISGSWLIIRYAFRRTGPGNKLSWRPGTYIALLMMIVLFSLPFLAYKLLPTFHNRVRYFLYDMSYSKNSKYLPGANDAVRVLSMHAGWSVMNEHPVLGTGYGDISKEVNKWYDLHYPEMIERDKILPSSQWIIYGTGFGWPGFLAFIAVMIIPLTIKTRIGLPWYLLNVSFLIAMLVDPWLEIQYGVFLYSFFILWWWKWPRN